MQSTAAPRHGESQTRAGFILPPPAATWRTH